MCERSIRMKIGIMVVTLFCASMAWSAPEAPTMPDSAEIVWRFRAHGPVNGSPVISGVKA